MVDSFVTGTQRSFSGPSFGERKWNDFRDPSSLPSHVAGYFTFSRFLKRASGSTTVRNLEGEKSFRFVLTGPHCHPKT